MVRTDHWTISDRYIYAYSVYNTSGRQFLGQYMFVPTRAVVYAVIYKALSCIKAITLSHSQWWKCQFYLLEHITTYSFCATPSQTISVDILHSFSC